MPHFSCPLSTIPCTAIQAFCLVSPRYLNFYWPNSVAFRDNIGRIAVLSVMSFTRKDDSTNWRRGRKGIAGEEKCYPCRKNFMLTLQICKCLLVDSNPVKRRLLVQYLITMYLLSSPISDYWFSFCHNWTMNWMWLYTRIFLSFKMEILSVQNHLLNVWCVGPFSCPW